MEHHSDHKSVEEGEPHAFLERMIVPFDVPRAAGVRGAGGPQYAMQGNQEQCALCRKVRSDPVHAASEQAADMEHWPV
jgi:hypothetical protein